MPKALLLSSAPTGTDVEDPIAAVISAMILEGDYDPPSHGLRDEDFIAHRRVHEFAVEFQSKTGAAPTPEQVLRKFSDFPLDTTADLTWAVHQAHQHVKTRHLRVGLTKALHSLTAGSPDEAMDLMRAVVNRAPQTSMTPTNAFDISIYDRPAVAKCPVAGTTLTDITGGIRPGHVWYVGARTNIGKSIELVRHAVTASEAGWDVVFFSLEMTDEEVMERIALIITGGEENMARRAKILSAWDNDPAKGRIDIYDPSKVRCDLNVLEAAAKPNTLLLVDHVGLMRTNAGNRTIEDHKFAAANSQDLKDLANRRKVPIIAAAQMNRSAEDDTAMTPKTMHKRLQLSDLSQSGSLEQDADLVYFLRGNRESTVRGYHVAKNRNGSVGHPWFVSFKPAAGTFNEISSARASMLLTNELDV